NSEPTVRRLLRLLHEPHTTLNHPPIRTLKVINTQEEPHPTSDLSPHHGHLLRPIRLREQEPRLRTPRTNNHPPLRPTIIRHSRRVPDKLKPEHTKKNPNRRVFPIDDNRHQRKKRHRYPFPARSRTAGRSTISISPA